MKLDGPRTARTQVAVAGARAVTAEMLSEQPRRAVIRNTLFASLVFLAIAIALTGLVVLIADSIVKGWSAFTPELLTNGTSSIPANAGLHSAIIGTLWIIGIVIVLIVPIGVGAAIFLEEYADPKGALAAWSRSTSRTSPPCLRSSTGCSASRSSRARR